MFYKYKDEEFHLISLIRKYCFVDILYIRDIKKNKFKPENIMRFRKKGETYIKESQMFKDCYQQPGN